jgi:hypothetical protein
MVDIVSPCIVLHNICIIGKDGLNRKWIEEVKIEFQKQVNKGASKE